MATTTATGDRRAIGRNGRIQAAIDFVTASHARALAVLAIVALVAFLPGFFQLPPIDRDEARYAQATRQMSETGNYIDIRYQDVPRYLQPAGIYWLQTAAVKLTGYGTYAPIWVHRLPSLIGATLAVLLTYWIALPFAGAVGSFVAALFMAVSILLGVEARLAKTDAVLLASILGAIGFLARAYLGHALGWAGAMGFWIAMAAGVVVKGPLIMLVVGSTTAALCIIDRSAAWLKALRPLPGIAVLLLLALPWYIAIGIVSDGEFYRIAIGKSFLGKVGAGEQGHGGPPGFYLALYWLTFWPAAGLALMAAPWVWQHRRERPVRFCLAWIVPTWLIFEVVATKLPHYVLPVYPAIAILIVMALLAGRRPWTLLAGLIALAALAYAALGPVLLYVLQGQLAWAAIVIALAGIAIAIWSVRFARSESIAEFPVMIAAAALLIHAANFGLVMPRLDSVWMTPRLVAAVKRQAPCPDPQVVSAGYWEASLVFLAGTKTQLIFGADAAKLMGAGGCRVALVSPEHETIFLEVMALQPRQVELRERVTGINIGNGRSQNIGVYVPK